MTRLSPAKDLAIVKAQYEDLRKIGEGSYGLVYKARNKKTQTTVAIKKVTLNLSQEKGIPSSSLREIASLKNLKHPNIIELLDIMHNGTSLFLIMEYGQQDLKDHIERTENGLEESVAKQYLWQLFKAIAYCHAKHVLHRDLKLQNILVDSQGNIKLVDFGLSRHMCLPLRALTEEVVTLWYRPPELLLGTQVYGPSVDTWSLGCIFYEMLTKDVLFPGSSEIDQLHKIFILLGTPNESSWPGWDKLLGCEANFPLWTAKNLINLSSKLSRTSVDLLDRIFIYDPTKRLSAKNALIHPFFESLRRRLTLNTNIANR